MAPSGMLCRVALVRIDVSEELSASFIRVTRIGELGTARRLLVTARVVPSSPILVTLIKEAQRSSETSVLTRSTGRNIPVDTILHSHRRENVKSSLVFVNTYLQSHMSDILFLYIQYIQGLCQSRLGTDDYALLTVAQATTVKLSVTVQLTN
jgi:hypothetical protein